MFCVPFPPSCGRESRLSLCTRHTRHGIVIPPKRNTISPTETSKLTYLKCTGGSPRLPKPHSFAQALYYTWDFQAVQILCCEEICTAHIQPMPNSRLLYQSLTVLENSPKVDILVSKYRQFFSILDQLTITTATNNMSKCFIYKNRMPI